MTNIMVFDIETVPDAESGRRLLNCENATPSEAVDALLKRQLDKTQGASSFLPHYLHQIVAISVVVRTESWVKVWSLGELDSTESELIHRFFQGLDKYLPTLVSWNGGGFDLPVLHYRSLLHGVVAPRYWDTGDANSDFKWNNYLGRYHQRHTDLMDVLSGYQGRACAPLDEIAKLLKLPGKMGMDGGGVLEKYETMDLQSIRDYCETDVLNTYLIFIKFQHIRGRLTDSELVYEETRLREHLQTSKKSHLLDFSEAWQP